MLNKRQNTSSSPLSSQSGSLPKAGKRRGWLILILLFLLLLLPEMAEAQCAMCRAALESEADNSQAEGINNGIVYLMAIPYILVGGVFYLIYRKVKG